MSRIYRPPLLLVTFAYNGHYYKYVKGLFTHAQAKASAEADGGYLGTVTSAGENAFVAALIAGLSTLVPG
jgi:hypothetical protein